MAKLILTEEEKKAEKYLDWSDESIGKMVRKLAFILAEKWGKTGDSEKTAIAIQACAQMLCFQMHESDADDLVIDLEGIT